MQRDIHGRSTANRKHCILLSRKRDIEGHFNLRRNMTLEEQFAKSIFPVLNENAERFPEGESLDDLGLFFSLLIILPSPS